MNCPDYEQRISRLLDGELPSGESGGVFVHLSACEACREFFHALQSLDGALNRVARNLPSGTGDYGMPLPGFLQPRTWWNQQVALRVPVLALLICAIVVSLFMALPGSPLFRESRAIYVTKLPTVVVNASTAPLEPRQ